MDTGFCAIFPATNHNVTMKRLAILFHNKVGTEKIGYAPQQHSCGKNLCIMIR